MMMNSNNNNTSTEVCLECGMNLKLLPNSWEYICAECGELFCQLCVQKQGKVIHKMDPEDSDDEWLCIHCSCEEKKENK